VTKIQKIVITGTLAITTIAGSLFLINQNIKNKIENQLKHHLVSFQKKMQKDLRNQVYYDFSHSKIKCKGFFNYTCSIKENYLTTHIPMISGHLLYWDMEIGNITLGSFKDLRKQNVDNLLFRINNLKPTQETSVLFLNNISKYAFPIDTQNIINIHTKKINKTNVKKDIELKNSYIKTPAFKIDYYGKLTVKDTPDGFMLYLNKKNEYIKKPENPQTFKTEIRVDSPTKIILHKTGYTLYNTHIPEMLYAWYKNVGNKYSFATINKNIFYINKSKILSFKEFNNQVIQILDKAITDALKVKNNNTKWFVDYLSALKQLYLHKVKAVQIKILNKNKIPLQALYVENRVFPGIYNQVAFLGKYYQIEIKVIK